jgi:hypothetical protein
MQHFAASSWATVGLRGVILPIAQGPRRARRNTAVRDEPRRLDGGNPRAGRATTPAMNVDGARMTGDGTHRPREGRGVLSQRREMAQNAAAWM